MGEAQEEPFLHLLSTPSRALSPWMTRVSLSPLHSPGRWDGQGSSHFLHPPGLLSHKAEHTSRPRGPAWEAPFPSGQLPGLQT